MRFPLRFSPSALLGSGNGCCGCTGPLGIDQLKRLQQHQYRATGKSYLDAFLQPFWEWFVAQMPPWLAPNLMTVLGLLINVITSVLVMMASPDAGSRGVPVRETQPTGVVSSTTAGIDTVMKSSQVNEPHPMLFVACAVGLFIYQTLDACDGKQARRTGSSSPLGELFDHGCDALSTIFVALSVCVAVQMAEHGPWPILLQCLLAMFLFYCAHWQTYVTGTLRFGRFDVTEAQFSVMAVHILTALFGQSFWKQYILGGYVQLRYVPFWASAIGALVALIGYLRICLSPQTAHVCNGSVTSGAGLTSESNNRLAANSGTALSPLIPALLTVAPGLLMTYKSPGLVANQPCLALLTFGLVDVKLTFRLIVAHMTRSELRVWDAALLAPLTLFFNQYLDFPLYEPWLLWAALVFAVVDLAIYSSCVCSQICDYLNIELFRIKPVSANAGGPGSSGSAHVTSGASMADRVASGCGAVGGSGGSSSNAHKKNASDEDLSGRPLLKSGALAAAVSETGSVVGQSIRSSSGAGSAGAEGACVSHVQRSSLGKRSAGASATLAHGTSSSSLTGPCSRYPTTADVDSDVARHSQSDSTEQTLASLTSGSEEDDGVAARARSGRAS